ncbi:hypothetical protein ET495_10405 [Xylanimonas allomyrinae]|uniref:Right-handed parallel beta-helix repeat-containing protein n=1 Tax=Xylanimonas allomyrinae TaxID=2509459 RepID=A0A4P6ELR7_9MICO|nr:hypothetical protein [Xylanimonas allomyrinae]QAY63592.1 hypothetical protein ET495_10405 [Xylanimonas allomyrinae]
MIALLVLATTPAVWPAGAEAAETPDHLLVVNSVEWGGPDDNLGDGICRTRTDGDTPVCTLRAAVEQANALNAAGAAGSIEITVADSIGPATRMVGGQSVTSLDARAARMRVTPIWSQDYYGAFFEVTGPVTIDLRHRLLVNGASAPACSSATTCDSSEGAAFYLNGPGITVRNADQVLSAGSSFVFGPAARDVVLDGSADGTRGHVIATDNYNPERFATFLPGARNVTIQHYDVRGYYGSQTDAGIYYFASGASAVEHVVIDDVVTSYPPSAGGGCGSLDGTGCAARIISAIGARIDGLALRHLKIANLRDVHALHMPLAWVNDLEITDGVFLGNNVYGTGESEAFLLLPMDDRLTGTTTVQRNVFTSAPGSGDVAIYLLGKKPAGSVEPSG